MKKLVSIVTILLCVLTVKAQYVEDALRYSQVFPTLTARSLALGGAFTSLGGDFSSTYTNPAGLGMYRKSEFSFTPTLIYNKNQANYKGETNDDYKYQFGLGNLGYVGTFITNREQGFVSASFAMGYNRMLNFNNRTYIRGINDQNSLVDHFMEDINGVNPENLNAFNQRLAFDAYLIDTVPGSDYEYTTAVPLPIDQRRIIETKGNIGDYTMAFGLNFSNTFYFGVGLHYYDLHYEQTSTHSEYDYANLSDLNYFNYTENFEHNGSGFNMNMGVMVRLFKIMRLGTSFQLPTYYSIKETYYNDMYSKFDNGFTPTDQQGTIYADGDFKYKLNTPFKWLSGASVQIGDIGFVSADLEYIDYSSMKLRESDTQSDFGQDNQTIKDTYCPVLNLKLGGEIRFDNISVRLGGGYYPSPYQSGELNHKASHTEFSTGLGYRNSHFFFDLGFSALMQKEKYYLYSAYDTNSNYVDNISDLTRNKYRFSATMGFRF
jgi:hypothetical protein